MAKYDYEPDNFTEAEVLQELKLAGLKYKNGQHYILAQCPTHEDQNPSAQIFKDDWFVDCHAQCGRYHITKAFPTLRGIQGEKSYKAKKQGVKAVSERQYKAYDLVDEWNKLPLIPRDHKFKNLPLDALDSLGWRWDEAKDSYFIPYFSSSKTSIPFAQWRHLSGERRFTFLKDAKPTCYGTWNLFDSDKLFVVEGTSDAAVLDYCSVPWIALPSASSGELMKTLATYCKEHDIQLIYAGDNDEAGDKLREALDEVMGYRIKQPPTKYKDWGDFFKAEGIVAVQEYADQELAPNQPVYSDETVASVADLMGGGTEIKIITPDQSKEQSSGVIKLL